MSCLFEDDVDVSGDELRYLLSLCGLNGVVTLLVLPEILQRTTEDKAKGFSGKSSGFYNTILFSKSSGDFCSGDLWFPH